jgi:hypothetical protein
MKTQYLTDDALDWVVGILEEQRMRFPIVIDGKPSRAGKYSIDWSKGGPIIERERIHLRTNTVWYAEIFEMHLPGKDFVSANGTTPLMAAMRCYVVSKLGDNMEIEVPEDLNKEQA